MGAKMKLKVAAALPNRWREGATLRSMLFMTIFVGGIIFLQEGYELGEPKAFLLSGLAAILVAYWSPPVPKETYIHWFITHSVLLFGLYLFLFKIPLLFSGLLSYRSAQMLGIFVYFTCCWLLIRQKAGARSVQ